MSRSEPRALELEGPRVGARLRMLWGRVWERIEADLRAQGYDDIGPSHLPVFRYPGPHGARPTELAERAQTTKQAMNYLLAYLESRGYLRREPDPLDGRSRIVRLTDRGSALLDAIVESVDALERDWAAVLGPRRWRQFVGALQELGEAELTPAAGNGTTVAQRAAGAAISRPSSRPR